MRFSTTPRAGLGLTVTLLSFAATLVNAHSWVESVYKVDSETRKFFGTPGYPRGGNFRRLSAEDPSYSDLMYIHQLPPNDGTWTGDENINSRPLNTEMPDEEIIEVAPGDFIAIQHLENGHVSKVEEGRPLNGGTLFIYGTAEPKDEENIFAMHLKWNKDGTGGDKRGRLLATRNWDDQQCYEGVGDKTEYIEAAIERSSALGTDKTMSMPCQSDIQLPDDLKPGSTYTIYWYWDWPTLDFAKIDEEGTKEGKFPWSGAFARGDKTDYDASVIVTAQSYASTVDMKVVEEDGYSAKEDDLGVANVDDPNAPSDVYSEAIANQLKDNFAVSFTPYEGGDKKGEDGEEPLPPSKVPEPPATPAPTSVAPEAPATEAPVADPVTVTVTKTVTDPVTPEPTKDCEPTSTQTVTEMETQVSTVWADAPTSVVVEDASTAVPTTMLTSTRTSSVSSSGYHPTPTPKVIERGVTWSNSSLPDGKRFVARRRAFVT